MKQSRTGGEQPERRILLLGAPRVERDRRLVAIERRKALALLAYLTVTGGPASREALATMLWPEASTTRALAYLRTTLWTLNTALGDDWCVVDGGLVRFNADAGITTDVAQFAALMHAAAVETVETLETAAQLWRGDFMGGFSLPDAPAFEEWQFFQAEALRGQFEGVLRRLIDHHAADSPARAQEFARRWLALDPLNEAAHRVLMRLYADAGARNAALRQYQEAVRALNEGLGVAPDDETTALFVAIRDGRALAVEAPQVAKTVPMRAASVPMRGPMAIGEIAAGDMPMPARAAVHIAPPPLSLPTDTTPFIGRATELHGVLRLLADPDCRLVTIIGPGGMGKTRLAVEAARHAQTGSDAPLFADGAYFAQLAPVRAPEYLPQALLDALNDCDVTGGEGQTDLFDLLRDKSALLVIDNFEHLLAGADLLSDLLAAAPGVKVLATSRERLHLREEWLYELRGLDYPSANGGALGEVAGVEHFGAVALFIQGARRARPQFAPRPADWPDIIAICRLLDGMPLGLELAASWVQMLSPGEIAEQIRSGLDFLSTDLRNIPERHRNLRAVFETSWRQLSFDQQACLSELSVFRGAFTLEAAVAVSGASLPLLRVLAGKSLVRRDESHPNAGGAQYTMHELLRQFAESKLAPVDARALAERHSAYFLGLLNRQLPALKSAEQPAALDLIGALWPDIVGAWATATESGAWALLESACEAIYHFAIVRRRVRDASELIGPTLARLDALGDVPEAGRLHVALLIFQAEATSRQGDRAKSAHLTMRAREALAPYRHEPAMALALIALGSQTNFLWRDDDEGERLCVEGLALAEASGDPWMVAQAVLQLGWFCQNHIRYVESRRYFERALADFRRIGQPYGLAQALGALSDNLASLGDFQSANDLMEETIPLFEALKDTLMLMRLKSKFEFYLHQEYREDLVQKTLAMVREAGDKPGLAWTLYHAGWSKLTQHPVDYDGVAAYFEEALSLFNAMNDLEGRTWTMVFLGQLALDQGDPDGAAAWADRAFAVLAASDFVWSRAGGLYLRGDIALARGDLAAARVHHHEALRIARDVQSVVQMLRHLVGVVACLIQAEAGDLAEHHAALRFVEAHQATPLDARNRIRDLLTQIEPALTPAIREAARAWAARQSLDDLVTHYLAVVAV